MPATKTTTKKTPSTRPAKTPPKLAKLPPATGAAAKPARQPRGGAKTGGGPIEIAGNEPPSVERDSVVTAIVRSDWRAMSEDWEFLETTRHRRGWQLVALSFGIAPVLELVKQLPELERERYKKRLRTVANSTTDKRSKTKLQYEKSLTLHEWQPESDRPHKKTDFTFDVVKFVDFFSRLPNNSTVDPAMVAAAAAFRALDKVPEYVKEVPERNANAAVKRIEGSLLDLVLGLAIRHYGYVPMGIAGLARNSHETKNVFESISEDTAEVGLKVSAKVVGKRLGEATERLIGRPERELFEAAIKKQGASPSLAKHK